MSTDQHYLQPGDEAYEEMYAQAVARFNAWVALTGGYNYAGMMGDLSIDPDRLAEIGAIVRGVSNRVVGIGNHEFEGAAGEAERIAKLAEIISEYGTSGAYYSIDAGWLKIIVLSATYHSDDTPMGVFTGHIPAAEFTWLANELAGAQKANLILIHHSPITGSSPGEGDWFNAVDLATLQTTLAGGEKVYVLCGHVHPANITQTALGSVPVYQIPALYVAGEYAEVTMTYCPIDGQVMFSISEEVLS